MMDTAGNFKDISGQRFGRLLVVSSSPSDKYGNARWACVCDCGAAVVARGFKLRNGHVKSCGCLSADATRSTHTTHGMSAHRLFRRWTDMKTRCTNPNREQWPDYGGRGITVCAEWLSSFEAFRDWSLANGYRDDLTIDRINNDGDYEPGNCRWATVKEQSLNTRRGRLPDGRRKVAVAAENGINEEAMRARIQNGWDALRACTQPLRPRSTRSPFDAISCTSRRHR